MSSSASGTSWKKRLAPRTTATLLGRGGLHHCSAARTTLVRDAPSQPARHCHAVRPWGSGLGTVKTALLQRHARAHCHKFVLQKQSWAHAAWDRARTSASARRMSRTSPSPACAKPADTMLLTYMFCGRQKKAFFGSGWLFGQWARVNSHLDGERGVKRDDHDDRHRLEPAATIILHSPAR